MSADCCVRFQKIKQQLSPSAFRAWYYHCFYCGHTLKKRKGITGKRLYTNDHVIPRSKGGGTNNLNLVPSCEPCNSSKGSMTIEEFRLKLYRNPNVEFAGEILLRRWETQLKTLGGIGARTNRENIHSADRTNAEGLI